MYAGAAERDSQPYKNLYEQRTVLCFTTPDRAIYLRGGKDRSMKGRRTPFGEEGQAIGPRKQYVELGDGGQLSRPMYFETGYGIVKSALGAVRPQQSCVRQRRSYECMGHACNARSLSRSWHWGRASLRSGIILRF